MFSEVDSAALLSGTAAEPVTVDRYWFPTSQPLVRVRMNPTVNATIVVEPPMVKCTVDLYLQGARLTAEPQYFAQFKVEARHLASFSAAAVVCST